jgi:hypothetical protein
MIDPTASMTLAEVKFSEGMSSLPLPVLLLLDDVVDLRVDLFEALVAHLGPL